MTSKFHPQDTQRGGPEGDLGLNLQQKMAVEAPLDKPLLIVAGAGTGKTRTLTSRIIHLIRNGVPPGQICALTFTNKAAKEMAERVQAGMERMAHGTLPGQKRFAKKDMPFLGTFHSLGARMLRVECRALNRTPNFAIFDDHDSSQLVRKILKSLGVAKPAEGPAWFLNMISRIKNGECSLDTLRDSVRAAERLAAEVATEYEQALATQNAFDFDDLIQKPTRLFRHFPAILQKYQRRFSHILVDEYQDVNNMQYEFVRLLSGGSGRVSVVGDDAQTIYSWRGSNFEIFLNFERDWPESTVVFLEENYRSSATIIQGASAVIKHNARQKPKELWTSNAAGQPITLIEAGDEDQEAAWIGEQVKSLQLRSSEVGDASSIEHLSSNPIKSIAILYRTNAQSRAVEQALLARRILYRVYGGLKFYERREVKDALAALRIAANPADILSRERLEKEFGKGRTAECVAAIETATERTPQALLQTFLRTVDYTTHLYKHFPNAGERAENIAELLRFAGRFEELPVLLEQVSLLQSTDAINDARGSMFEAGGPVELMTMHLAKGLEFDAVFVAGCAEGFLPHARSEGQAQLEEERRLFYVAMTRARRELFLSFYGIPSRFLGEIPPELLRFQSLASGIEQFEADDEERYITLE